MEGVPPAHTYSQKNLREDNFLFLLGLIKFVVLKTGNGIFKWNTKPLQTSADDEHKSLALLFIIHLAFFN